MFSYGAEMENWIEVSEASEALVLECVRAALRPNDFLVMFLVRGLF